MDRCGTLICDDYKGYETLFKLGARVEAGCAVHSRRKFHELIKHGHSEFAGEAVRRMAVVFKIEQQIQHCDDAERLELRQQITRPHWDGLLHQFADALTASGFANAGST